jgi:hypothetical protein
MIEKLLFFACFRVFDFFETWLKFYLLEIKKKKYFKKSQTLRWHYKNGLRKCLKKELVLICET